MGEGEDGGKTNRVQGFRLHDGESGEDLSPEKAGADEDEADHRVVVDLAAPRVPGAGIEGVVT